MKKTRCIYFVGYNISLNDNRHGIVKRIRGQYWKISVLRIIDMEL